ncbi:MAG: hypothetical protein M1820_003041 [Bogoriella megaspora]|nr:MAG: hypothetical protein M1820_003041 [Bogoriella megaspora]
MGDDFTEKNRKVFDDLATKYDAEEWQKKIVEQVTNEIRARLNWLGVEWADPLKGNEVKLLDYACGPGTVSRALGPHVTHTLGVDLSPSMVTTYNTRFSTLPSLPLPHSSPPHAIVGNILDDSSWDSISSNPEYQNFDIAVISLGVHHFSSPSLAIERLTQLLKPGTGVLLMIDFVKEGAEGGGDSEEERRLMEIAGGTINHKHNGFVKEEVRGMFERAGLEGWGWDTCESRLLMKREDVTRIAFFARGVRKGVEI